ncbi:hypothetical protein [Pantoea sp. A4]|uniref:hypothetical protein n=1 Tax=Pantoea sp. A4 TaxID=1225184 RepID=UPI00036E6065|nr:hypothetical protein [Pantoea sp. A4]
MKPESVFKKIVTDPTNPFQVLAYAEYKMDKHEIAERFSQSGQSEQQLQLELKRFHDAVLDCPRLIKSYHFRALNIGNGLLEGVKDNLIKTANQDFIERVLQLQKQQQSPAYRVIRFFLEGLKNLTATNLAMILFSGVYALTLNKSERQKLLPAVTQSVMGLINGEVPVIDSYRHHTDSLQIVD